MNPFHDMFASRYEYIAQNELAMIYFMKQEEYKTQMEKAFFWQLKRLKTTPLIGREPLEDYKDTIKRIDDKRHKNYDYIIDNRELQFKKKYAWNIIMRQIYYNIFKREQKGEDQTQVKFQLQQYFKGNQTKGNHHTVMELVAEANTQVGLFKLPVEYMKLKELIYK